MADKKISQLTGASTPLAGTEVLPIVQGGSTVKVAVSDLTAGRAVSAASYALGTVQTVITGGMWYQTSGGKLAWTPASTGGFKWNNWQNTVEIASLDNAGKLTVADNLVVGTAAKGIDFSANTGAAGETSSLLNWYEEGTWTPVVADASTGGNTGTFSGSATYTRIGRQVTVRMYISNINTTGMTAGNTLFIRGLPFASAATAQGSFYTYQVGRDASTVSSCANIPGAGSFFNFALFTTNSATADKTILVSDIVSGTSEIQATITYFV
jgi:hypothetical protein